MSEFACSSCGIQGNIEPGESVGAGHAVLQLQEGMLSQLFETQPDNNNKIITILSGEVDSGSGRILPDPADPDWYQLQAHVFFILFSRKLQYAVQNTVL
jgi:hypothetical protein